MYLNERGVLPDVTVIPRTDPGGRRHFDLFGPSDRVKSKRKEIAEAHPDLHWEEKLVPDKGRVEVVFLAGDHLDLLRRLAAKVAFERFAQIRNAEFVTDTAYDDVRTYILTGSDQSACVCQNTARKVLRECPK